MYEFGKASYFKTCLQDILKLRLKFKRHLPKLLDDNALIKTTGFTADS